MAAGIVISLGIGAPAGIPQFILAGLAPSPLPPSRIVLAGRSSPTISLAGRSDSRTRI